MGDNFIGELRLFSFGFAPSGWAECNGQAMQIQQNQALYSLMGVQFGGDAKTTFLLPDLRGRVALGVTRGNPLPPNVTNRVAVNAPAGEEQVTLTAATGLLSHTHQVNASTATGTANSPAGGYLADVGGGGVDPNYAVYNNTLPIAPLDAATVTSGGGGAPHPNMQPFVVLNYCIALTGTYPSRN